MATQSVLIEKSAHLVASLNSRRVAILGFGTVGKSVARDLSEGRRAGLELSQVFNRNVERKRVPWVKPKVQWTENIADLLASHAESVGDVLGGRRPSQPRHRALVRAARP